VVLLVLALSACGDLVPDLPEVMPTRDTATSGDGDALLPDAISCTTDDDCAPYAGCCFDPRCVSGTCLPGYVPSCCIQPGPCATSTLFHDGTCDVACEAGGCVESLEPPPGSCDTTLWRLSLTPEGVAGLTLVDNNPGDRVTWSLAERRPFSGEPTLYAGDVACPTYYAGPLGPDCHALDARDAGPIDVAFTTPPLLLPSDLLAVAQLWLWIDVGAGHVDGVTVQVSRDGYGTRTVWDSRQADSARGEWTPVLIDLAAHAGSIIRLIVDFDTFDGRDNDHEGAYVGGLEVHTLCADDLACPAASACAIGRDVPVSPFATTACVVAPADPGPACQPCVGPETCPRSDSCDVARCDAGVCGLDHELTAECCTPDPSWPGDGSFEGALEAGWDVDDGWATSGIRSLVGERALHFGLPDGSAIAPPGMSAAGVVWSPPLTVPRDAPVWSFATWLSTEWDAAPSSDNPAGVDLLEALVVPAANVTLPEVVVWDSRVLGGTTLGQWERVRVALDAFAGRKVRLGFRFRTGDAEANEGEGAYIDDARVFRACPGCGPEAVAPGCDPGSTTP